MFIGIDASNIRQGGGITHICELLSYASPHKHGFNKITIWGGSHLLDRIEDRDWIDKVYCRELDLSLFRRLLWQIFKLNKLAEDKKCNILLVPGGFFFCKFRPIVTISQNLLPFEFHEMMRYFGSTYFYKYILLRLVQSRSFKLSTAIIFLTNYGKEAVLRTLHFPQIESRVISHGVSTIFSYNSRHHKLASDFSLTNPIQVLYVSIVSRYKHQWNVVAAISKLRSEGVPVILNLVGPSAEGMYLLEEALQNFDPSGEFIHYLGEVPYDNLNKVYADADIGIFASSCETFGMILLEKMRSGLPIACSNKSSLSETLGDAGLYFDPEDVGDISSSLNKLINSFALRKELSSKGFSRSNLYSWEKCANETFEYLKLISDSYRDSNLLPPGAQFHEGLASSWTNGYLEGSFSRRKIFFHKLFDRHISSSASWVDFGCGSGVLTQCLLNLGANVKAVDLSPKMLSVAAVNLQNFSDERLTFMEANIESAPELKDETFDGVLASSVFEYLDDPDAALHEVFRILRPGGLLIFTIPSKRSLIRGIQKLIRSTFMVFGCDLYPYLNVSKYEMSQLEVMDWLRKFNFKVIRISKFDPIIPHFLSVFFPPSLLSVEAIKSELL